MRVEKLHGVVHSWRFFPLCKRVGLFSSDPIPWVSCWQRQSSQSRTLLSRRNFNKGTSANMSRITLRTQHRSMIILLKFFARLTSIFAPVSDSVEMIRFVTFATCHVKTNGSPFSKSVSDFFLSEAFHATSNNVTQDWQVCRSRQQWEIVGIIDWAGRQARSRIQQRVFCSVQALNHESLLGRYDHVDVPRLFRLRRLTAVETRDKHHLLQRDWCLPCSVHNSLAGKAASCLSLWLPLLSCHSSRTCLQRCPTSSFCSPTSYVSSSRSTCIHHQSWWPLSLLFPCPCLPSWTCLCCFCPCLNVSNTHGPIVSD